MPPGEHIRPVAPVAGDAILPGDPKRAMELATALMERPLMSNLNRGLWGYHGLLANGRELTIQSTGLGGPSAAIVLGELAALGVRRAIRVGTCTAIDGAVEPGVTILVSAAFGADGVSAALGADVRSLPDAGLAASLRDAVPAATAAVVATTDLPADQIAEDRRRALAADGAVAIDLSTAPLFALGDRLGVAVASLLVVTEAPGAARLGDDEADAATCEAGSRAAQALLGA